MKYIWLVCFIIIILCVLYYLFQHSKIEHFTEMKCTDNKILNQLRNLLFMFNILAHENDITWWVDGGTLLGAMRHDNIIPWDDDADISIMESDKEKLLKLKDKFNYYNIGIVKFWGGYRIFYKHGDNIHHENRNWNWHNSDVKEKFNYKYPFVDIFFVKSIDGKYQYADESVREIYSKFYYESLELFPLKRKSFDNFYVNIPHNPIAFLNRAYGDDWKTIGYKEYDHQNMQFLNKKKFNISDVKCM